VRLVAAVFTKEMVETLRDRRTVVVALVLPVLLMPVVTLGVPYLAERQQHQREGAPSRIAVVGASRAPGLLAAGDGRSVIRSVDVADAHRALAAGTIDAVVEIPEDLVVIVVFDESRPASVVARRRVEEVVAAYSLARSEQRLRQAGLSRQDLAPIRVASHSVADQRRLGAVLLAGLLPFFIAIWAVVGGQHAALDAGAGEKERRTLETLLVAPAPRWVLAGGKFLAVTASSVVAVMVVIVATLASLRLGAWWGIAELARASLTISAGPALSLCAVAFGLVAFLSALQLALSLLARGVREAQQYFTPVYLVVSLPAMAAPFLEGWERSGWTFAAPGLGPIFAFRGLLLGTLAPTQLALTLASTGLYTACCLALAVLALRGEPAARRPPDRLHP